MAKVPGTVTLAARVPREVAEAYEREAKRRGLPRGRLLAEALQLYAAVLASGQSVIQDARLQAGLEREGQSAR